MIITRFDLRRDMIEQLVEFARENHGDLPDWIFVQACDEFHVEEEDIMVEMARHSVYRFTRYRTGWMVNKHKNLADYGD